MNTIEWHGKEVIRNLAEIYRQLYLVPGDDGERLYPEVVLKGKEPGTNDLSHFRSSDNDACRYEQTPAGEVLTITLCAREDFETFLQIMGNKCRTEIIPATQGAAILDGVINRTRIDEHMAEFERKIRDNGREPDMFETMFERKRFLSERKNYTDALIILSVGPYSGVPYTSTEYGEDEWIRISQEIRKYHECTHFVCRRLFPDKIDAIWDELIADAAGIIAAVASYDALLAKTVLGITDDRYTGGRLQNYVSDFEDITSLLPRVLKLISDIESEAPEYGQDPFGFAVHMEQIKDDLWK